MPICTHTPSLYAAQGMGRVRGPVGARRTPTSSRCSSATAAVITTRRAAWSDALRDESRVYSTCRRMGCVEAERRRRGWDRAGEARRSSTRAAM